jgi:histidinol-phosphate aminotransferase
MAKALKPATAAFWQAYLATVADPAEAQRRFWEAFSVGDTPESAAAGAELILRGEKTTTSSLLSGFEARSEPVPTPGALSILEDGLGEPVAIIETFRVEIQPFHAIDADFAYAYGEWDRTLETWRKQCHAYYARQLGQEPADDPLLVCEWIRVVFPPLS